MRLILSLLILITVSCTTHKNKIEDFSNYFWPDLSNPKIALEKVIDMQTIKQNYSFFRKFFGIDYEIPPLYRPYAIAANDEYIAVSDIMFGIIYLIDKKNIKLTILKEFNKQKLKSIVDLDFVENDLYIIDSDNNYIIRYNIITKETKFLDIQTDKPVAIKVDKFNKKIFISDIKRNRIVVTDLSGNILQEMNLNLNHPIDIDIDPNRKNIYILDSMNFRVIKADYNGNIILTFGEIGKKPGNFSKPKGICIDQYKRLYITDSDFDNFQIFDTNGNLLYFIGENGSDPDKFYMPERVYCFEDELYISDLFNSRIKIYKLFK